jgi:hypothetical protein
MYMKSVILAAVCGALILPTVSFAQVAGAPAAPATQGADRGSQPTPAADAKPKKERKICIQVGETGSRLGAKAVCKTQREWDEQRAAQRSQTETDQRTPR